MRVINSGKLTDLMLLSNELRNKISDKVRAGISINHISKELSLGKSTIYYYYKKIKGKKFIEPEFKLKNSRLEGEINGIFAGDGSQYYDAKRGSYEVNVHFGAKNYWYAVYVKKLFEGFFNKKFRLNWDSETQIRVRTQSRKIFNYFQNYLSYNCHIKHCTVKFKDNCSPDFKIGFLKGMFDTDGCYCYAKSEKKFRAFYTTTSKMLSTQMGDTLTELGIIHSVRSRQPTDPNEKMVYTVDVWRAGTNRFIKLVKPMKSLRARSSVR